eukprot:1646456-Amphidinium_carterae.1
MEVAASPASHLMKRPAVAPIGSASNELTGSNVLERGGFYLVYTLNSHLFQFRKQQQSTHIWNKAGSCTPLAGHPIVTLCGFSSVRAQHHGV